MGDEKRNQRLVRFTRTETGLEREDLWPVRFVPLLPDLPDGEDGGSGQSY
jgi:protein-L-isoaspartate(D-aspartate) O-methyltransferase